MYFSFRMCYMYGILGWCSAARTAIKLIQILQNNVLNIINYMERPYCKQFFIVQIQDSKSI